MSTSQAENALMEAFEFTAADLEANRGGVLTQPQRVMLRKVATRMRVLSAIAWAVFALIVGGMGAIIYFGDRAGAGNFQKSPATLLILIAVLGAVMLVVTVSVVWGWQMSNALMAGKFNTIEGPAKLQLRRSTRSYLNQYRLFIGNKRFYMTKTMFEALSEGVTYRAHYAQNTILSIE